MTRLPRNQELKDCHFVHVLIEGIDNINEGSSVKIFKDKRNKERYRTTIKKCCDKYEQSLVAYLILDNNCHLIFKFKTVEGLSTCIKSLNLSYSQIFNRNHKRSGVLFKNRFKSEPLNTVDDLLYCIRFLHNKPVDLKICNNADDYLFSSCTDYLLRSSNVVDFEPIKEYCNGEIPVISLKPLNEDECINYTTNKKFLETSSETNEDFTKVLNELVHRYNIPFGNAYENLDGQLIFMICKELKVRTGCSLRKIANELEINREKIRRIMIKYKDFL